MSDIQPRRLPLTLAQILLVVSSVMVLLVVFGVNRNLNRREVLEAGEATNEARVEAELTMQVHLSATLAYVESDSYVDVYNRAEGNRIRPGEVRVVPVTVEATPPPTPMPPPTPDPAQFAQPWQMWWYLLTDRPAPVEEPEP